VALNDEFNCFNHHHRTPLPLTDDRMEKPNFKTKVDSIFSKRRANGRAQTANSTFDVECVESHLFGRRTGPVAKILVSYCVNPLSINTDPAASFDTINLSTPPVPGYSFIIIHLFTYTL
jgi:hypothetical protein